MELLHNQALCNLLLAQGSTLRYPHDPKSQLQIFPKQSWEFSLKGSSLWSSFSCSYMSDDSFSGLNRSPLNVFSWMAGSTLQVNTQESRNHLLHNSKFIQCPANSQVSVEQGSNSSIILSQSLAGTSNAQAGSATITTA